MSQQQCLSTKRYTCADKISKPSDKIKEGAVIFLYNWEDKNLLGPFTSLDEGAQELDSGTWIMNVDEHIPSEDVKIEWENLHLIKNAEEELPFLKEQKTCRLSTTQTQRILELLKQGELYIPSKKEANV
jgi:hypothetical protein